MFKRIFCLGCVVVGLFGQGVLAADAEVGPAEKLAAASGKTAPRAKDARESARTKRESETKKQSPVQNLALECWNSGADKYFSFGALGYRIFPLALLIEGRHAFELFQVPDRSTLPARLVCAQFSRQFVEQYFQRAIESEDVVDDTILGTKIDGQSHLSGVIGISLMPSSKEIRFELVFKGVCRSRTAGVNTVVVLQNTAETQFEARKEFVWNSQELTHLPTVAQAETHSKLHQVDTELPGVIGRIARQIAEQKVAEVRPQADAIAAQHAAKKIESSLDARVDDSLAWVRLVSRHLPVAGFIQRATRTRLSCTGDAVQVLLLRRDAMNSPAATKMPPLPHDCDISIQIHRGMWPAMIRDPLALLMGAAIANQIVATEDPATAESQTDRSLNPPALAWRLTRSPDGEWLIAQHIQQTPNSRPVSAAMPAEPAVR